MPRDGRYVDDPPVAALLHAGNRGARHVDQPVDVGAPHALQVRRIESLECGADRNPGVIHKDGWRPEFAGRASQHVLDLRGIADVRAHGIGTPACRADLLDYVLPLATVSPIIDGHRRALPPQPPRT